MNQLQFENKVQKNFKMTVQRNEIIKIDAALSINGQPIFLYFFDNSELSANFQFSNYYYYYFAQTKACIILDCKSLDLPKTQIKKIVKNILDQVD